MVFSKYISLSLSLSLNGLLSESQDECFDKDNSKQTSIHGRAVDLLVAALDTTGLTSDEISDIGKTRQPPSEKFNTLWDDVVAVALQKFKAPTPCL